MVSLILFFVVPTFLASHRMQYFTYLPYIDPIGVDLKQVLTSTKFILAGENPYGVTRNLYPPLTYVLFRPLLRVNLTDRYAVVTWMTLVAYAAANVAFPIAMIRGKRVTASLMLVFVTGLMSYGFQFELERGQFNVIAVLLALGAVWIYHRHYRFRLLAYLLLTLSVQLKLYPIVFSLMLIRDWRDWRGNTQRLVLLTAVNFSLLFVLGIGPFMRFVGAVRAESGSPDWVWVGNHSVHGFLALYSRSAPVASSALWQWLLLLVVVGCVFFVGVQAYLRDEHRMDPHLLLACTLASLLLPAISNDYTLAILGPPVAILLSHLEASPGFRKGGCIQRTGRRSALLLFSSAYSATLLSYTNKPPTLMLQNDYPALMVLLLTVALMSTWPKEKAGAEVPSPPAMDRTRNQPNSDRGGGWTVGPTGGL